MSASANTLCDGSLVPARGARDAPDVAAGEAVVPERRISPTRKVDAAQLNVSCMING